MKTVLEYIAAIGKDEADAIVKAFAVMMNQPSTGDKRIHTAFDLLPQLKNQPTFKEIQDLLISSEKKTRLSKAVLDEVLAQCQTI